MLGLLRRILLIAFLALGISVAGNTLANSEEVSQLQDDYYASDLDAAITQARRQTHHYDYSSPYRYDRTTSQSILFPRMGNTELEQQRIETVSLASVDANGHSDTEHSSAKNSGLTYEWNGDNTEKGISTNLLERNKVLPAAITPDTSRSVNLPSNNIKVQVNVR